MGGGAGLSASTTTPLLLLLLLATSVTGGGLLLLLCRTDCRVMPPAWVCRVGPAPPPPSPSGVRCAVVGLGRRKIYHNEELENICACPPHLLMAAPGPAPPPQLVLSSSLPEKSRPSGSASYAMLYTSKLTWNNITHNTNNLEENASFES